MADVQVDNDVANADWTKTSWDLSTNVFDFFDEIREDGETREQALVRFLRLPAAKAMPTEIRDYIELRYGIKLDDPETKDVFSGSGASAVPVGIGTRMPRRAAIIQRAGALQEAARKRRHRQRVRVTVAKALQLKEVRHVRTPEGAAHFGQPIGSVIVKDRPLKRVRVVNSDYEGWDKVVSGDGKHYYIGKHGGKYKVTDNKHREVLRADSLDDAYKKLDDHLPEPTPSKGMHFASDAERKKLVIPPAWAWPQVADSSDASLQVLGYDIKGRRQARYSADHTKQQAATKYERTKVLNKRLDKLDSSLKKNALTDDDAAIVLLARKLGMRVGSRKKTGADQQAYGASTLQARHVKVYDTGRTSFDFIGKKGVRIQLTTKDPLIHQVMSSRLKNKSGKDDLFASSDKKATAYLKSQVGNDFKFKDLRTVVANTVAMTEMKKYKSQPKTKAEFRRWRKEVATKVSAQLGNNPAEAIKSYINPTIWTQWIQDETWL